LAFLLGSEGKIFAGHDTSPHISPGSREQAKTSLNRDRTPAGTACHAEVAGHFNVFS
jgi:hypothetical protein